MRFYTGPFEGGVNQSASGFAAGYLFFGFRDDQENFYPNILIVESGGAELPLGEGVENKFGLRKVGRKDYG